ncbi:MAG: PaaI family thioesterase [Pseudomonadota bacterium]
MDAAMTGADLEAFLQDEFPQAAGLYSVLEVTGDGVRVAQATDAAHLRPGGTVSGPTLFALADVGFYLAILSRIGPEALTVTTNCSIDFMRKPPSGARLVCTARLLKLGRVLAVGDALIHADGLDGAVARASLTYSIPPKR